MEAPLFVLFLLLALLAITLLVFLVRVSMLSRDVNVLKVQLRDLRRRLQELTQAAPRPPAVPSDAAADPLAGKPAHTPEKLTEEMLAIEREVESSRTATPGSLGPPGSPALPLAGDRPGPAPHETIGTDEPSTPPVEPKASPRDVNPPPRAVV